MSHLIQNGSNQINIDRPTNVWVEGYPKVIPISSVTSAASSTLTMHMSLSKNNSASYNPEKFNSSQVFSFKDYTEKWAEEYVPRTELGRKLMAIRARIIKSGEPLLDLDGLEKEIAERRGGVLEKDEEKANLC